MPIRGTLGSYPTDYEQYFERWDCVMYYPSPLGTDRFGFRGVTPCFRHKTCGNITKAFDKKPPRVCRVCSVDTLAEVKEEIDSKTRIGTPLNLEVIINDKA